MSKIKIDDVVKKIQSELSVANLYKVNDQETVAFIQGGKSIIGISVTETCIIAASFEKAIVWFTEHDFYLDLKGDSLEEAFQRGNFSTLDQRSCVGCILLPAY